ncbi:hypothetical protein HBB16_11110 [Pseudonocardia sp. MCCB 268]|nr:hypothetical protein [Pseudonocardia cytotoxica]
MPAEPRRPSSRCWPTGDGPGAAKSAPPVPRVWGCSDRAGAPGRDRGASEARQREVYTEVLSAFAGKPVTARTPGRRRRQAAAVFVLDGEPNLALGVRGLRIARVAGTARACSTASSRGWPRAAKETGVAPRDGADGRHRRGVASGSWSAAGRTASSASASRSRSRRRSSPRTRDHARGRLLSRWARTTWPSAHPFAADRQSGPVAALNDPWQPALLRLIGDEISARPAWDRDAGRRLRGEAAGRPELLPVLVGWASRPYRWVSGRVSRRRRARLGG